MGLDKSEVNSALYGPLRSKVEQDNDYRWHLAGSRRVSEVRTASTGSLDTPLAHLATYYLDCIAHEGVGGVGVFASSQWPDYVALPVHPLVSEDRDPLMDAGVAGILRRTRTKGGEQLAHFLGYPVHAKFIRSQRSKWEGFILEPIFLHAVTEGGVEETAPHLNLAAIESLTGTDRSGLMEEAISLVGELGLDRTYDQLPDVDELMHRLRDLHGDWPWVEEPDPYHLSAEPSLDSVSTAGIYNRAIVLAVERPPYTRGLETELGGLRAVPELDYTPTALGQWLSTIPTGSAGRRQPLLEPLPLNAEQRQAVEQALENPLTVITGPPGTGKSQVVSSILVNAAWRGMTTLFASKNNKAVDVVEVRVNALGPRPVVLRLGSGEYQARLSTYLSGLLAATASEHDRKRYEELEADHQRLAARAAELDRQLTEVIDLRNLVDTLEIAAEPAREALGPELFAQAPDLDFAQARSALAARESAVDAADRARQGLLTRLFWNSVRRKRFARLLATRAETAGAIEWLGVTVPGAVDDSTIGSWHQFLERTHELLDLAKSAAEYGRESQRLAGVSSPEAIAKARSELVEKISVSSERLWNGWLRLQPARLTPEQRRQLGDYAATLELIVSTDAEGRRAGREVFKKYHSLFPQIVHSLPCWAITSLSVRNRVPFTPGFFDLLVVDEASQCDIASLLPLLYRAKRVAVIGDPMQLRHVSTLSPQQDQQLLGAHDLLDRIGWSYSARSAFDLAASVCRSSDLVTLRDHHRSHADIIEFSNREFYEQQLRVVTRYQRLKRPSMDGPAVRWVDVRGTVRRPSTGGAVNEREAEAVIGELRRLVVEQRYAGSVGAVSPFRAHANRIRDLVSQDTELNRFLAPGTFIADTVHRFQGDERDVMIFSPAVSEGVHRGAIAFLQANPNLFNVAVTRARSALVVVGDLAAARDSGVPYLSRFAEYVVGLDRDRSVRKRRSTADLGAEYPIVPRPIEVSPWEMVLYRALYEAGLRPIPQHEVDNYRLDLALFDGRRRLDVEVDGERYHRAWDGEHARRDQLRTQRLIELGWDVMRLWVYQVRDDLAGCVDRVVSWAASGRD